MRVCVLYNLTGTSSTQDIAASEDDTTESAREVCEALQRLGHEPTLKGISQAGIDTLVQLETDMVFNLIEWSGREMHDGVRVLQILEQRQIPYTGCTSEGYQLSTDKWEMKRIMQREYIPTPRWFCAENDTIPDHDLQFPLIVKPSREHCAIGIHATSVVQTPERLAEEVRLQLHRYEQPILVEEFIDGLEAHVTVMDTKAGLWVLPPAIFEYEHRAGFVPAMTYEAKWGNGEETQMTEWVETVSESVHQQIDEIAKKAYVALGGRSYSRLDMRMRGDQVFLLEINNNPGISWDEDSGLTHACIAAGLTFDTFIKTIIETI